MRKKTAEGGFLWWRGAVGRKEREWAVVGGLGDERKRGGNWVTERGGELYVGKGN